MRKRKQSDIFIDSCPLCGVAVELYGRITGESGAEFDTCPDGGSRKPARITIDLLRPQLWFVIRSLYHEVIEAILVFQERRYEHTSKISGDVGSYLFVFDHPQLSEMSAQASWFIWKVQPKLIAAYSKQRRKKQKRKRG